MKRLLIAGIVLVVLGVAGLAVNVLSVRHQQQATRIGSSTINSEKEADYIIPNYVGIIAIIAGVTLVVAGTRRS